MSGDVSFQKWLRTASVLPNCRVAVGGLARVSPGDHPPICVGGGVAKSSHLLKHLSTSSDCGLDSLADNTTQACLHNKTNDTADIIATILIHMQHFIALFEP